MKHLKFIGVLSTLIVAAVAVLNLGPAHAQVDTSTDTLLGINTGVFSFYKDLTGDVGMMDAVRGTPNASDTINLGTYPANFYTFDAYSSGDHRFVVSDLLGSSFHITIVSSDMTAAGGLVIPAANVSYTGTTWEGTGAALTQTGQFGSLGTVVTFVGRQNNSGLSLYGQEITLKVAVPAAQTPGVYTGLLTFTLVN